jgi:hypothetical protein
MGIFVKRSENAVPLFEKHLRQKLRSLETSLEPMRACFYVEYEMDPPEEERWLKRWSCGCPSSTTVLMWVEVRNWTAV